MARLEGARLILAVRNFRAATDFYVNALGFRRDFGDESDGWSWLSRDNVRVGLGECTDAVPATELGDHSYVAYVNVDDIDGLYAEFNQTERRPGCTCAVIRPRRDVRPPRSHRTL